MRHLIIPLALTACDHGAAGTSPGDAPPQPPPLDAPTAPTGIATPRLIAPLSMASVTRQRPRLR